MAINNRKGMTLIEILGALLILGLVGITVISAFVAARYYILRTHHRINAANLVSSELERYISMPYVNIVPGTYTENVLIDDMNTSGDTSDDVNGTMETLISDSGAGDYRKVQVSVSWQERGQEGQTTLAEQGVTYVVQE